MDPFKHLMNVFFDEKGTLRFSIADIEHVLPWCLLHLPINFTELDDATTAIFARACKAAGVNAKMTGEEVRASFDRYYDENPPNATICQALEGAWREVNAGATG